MLCVFREKSRSICLKPEIPTDCTVKKLESLIKKCLEYDKVLCVIDMDTKLANKKEMADYLKMKKEYSNHPKVKFFETHPCTELWFYYHFAPTTQLMQRYSPELKQLIRKKIKNYEKKLPFCTHDHICTKCGGKFEEAVNNSRESIKSKQRENREVTYSEMHLFFEEIGFIERV